VALKVNNPINKNTNGSARSIVSISVETGRTIWALLFVARCKKWNKLIDYVHFKTSSEKYNESGI
jgi:hypothetical protein